jgi:transcriptional regulator with XRE-family HTH domain
VEEILASLGQRIRELRKRKGYSQEAFADATGLHRTWMGAVERGERNLSFRNLVLVSKALGLTLSQLLSGVERRAEMASQNPAGSRRQVGGKGKGKDELR